MTAQNGYVILNENGEVIVGYLKYFCAVADGQRGIEVWKPKKDKEPLKISMNHIFEYAIRKDTFRVLQNFKPFPRSSIYMGVAEAEIVASGKIICGSSEITRVRRA